MIKIRYVLCMILGVLLGGCGFAPFYADNNEHSWVKEELTSIKVMPIAGRLGQDLHTAITDALNPLSEDAPTKYHLQVKIETLESPLAIQQDRTATRYKITLTTHYKLINIHSSEIVDSGKIKGLGGYDAVESEYATYVAKHDNMSRTIKEMGQNFKIHLAASILNSKH